MLHILKIENVALVDKVTLQFDEKLNVISGETGAGKSIMLDSLGFVFGGRADRTLIRSGENKMRVEAIFSLDKPHIEFISNKLNISCDDEMFLSRELDINGRNICKINGELVPVATVKKICQRLVDIHGQSEHLAILNNDYQLQIIDLFSKKADNHLIKLRALIEKVKEIDVEIKSLGGTASEKQNLIDLYTYQINEINSAEIKENEYEELLTEKKTMQQYEKINENLRTCYEENCKNSFGESAVDRLNSSRRAMQNISTINTKYDAILSRINSVILELEDINDTVHEELSNNVFDEERFNYIDNRLDYIKSLFRKYGGDYSKMMNYYEDITCKLDNLINGEKRYQQLVEKKELVLVDIDKVQTELSEIRKRSATALSDKMQEELRALGMPNARMSVDFSRIEDRYSYNGFDRVEFLFSSNLGFEMKALNKVVSGGEMSRVMLAYKSVVSSVDEIHTIVFDEIDSGLSGNIASVVAKYMARLSRYKQVIAVSHLPQICAMADENIKVEKFTDKITTHTRAVELLGESLLLEIARLMGADNQETGIKVSGELKTRADEYKLSLK